MRKSALGGLFIGAVMAAGAVGCTTVQEADAKPAVTTTTTAGTAQQVDNSAVDNNGDSGDNSAVSGSHRPTTATTTTRHTTTTTTTTTKPATSGPKILSFTVVSKPACPVLAKPGAPYSNPGAPVVISWKVSGASGVAISVDSPNMYGSYGSDYPASGQLELQFPCDTTPGKTTHVYTVWPKDAKTVSQNLTVSATNNT
ncbi:hypothetical protein [Actinokineospora inagensis]|uniref:hypothetical protein n=1 Tax=Actinokineospora inagensis TaxID=103730 RepID=UPI0012F8C677|nr:hypothetical protein [Actinokineospora inagensis]